MALRNLLTYSICICSHIAMGGDGEEAMDVDLDELPPTNTHTTSQQ